MFLTSVLPTYHTCILLIVIKITSMIKPSTFLVRLCWLLVWFSTLSVDASSLRFTCQVCSSALEHWASSGARSLNITTQSTELFCTKLLQDREDFRREQLASHEGGEPQFCLEYVNGQCLQQLVEPMLSDASKTSTCNSLSNPFCRYFHEISAAQLDDVEEEHQATDTSTLPVNAHVRLFKGHNIIADIRNGERIM